MCLRVLLLAVLFASCSFEAEPEMTCEWTSTGWCLCSGRQPHDAVEARMVCCESDAAPQAVCGGDGSVLASPGQLEIQP